MIKLQHLNRRLGADFEVLHCYLPKAPDNRRFCLNGCKFILIWLYYFDIIENEAFNTRVWSIQIMSGKGE